MIAMYILGLSCFYHDAAACLLKDGKIVAAAEEERFTRIKHDINFPINAINYCLTQENIKINDVDFIGFYEKPLLKFERILHSHLEMFPWSFWTFFKTIPSWLNEKLKVPSIIRKKLHYNGEILFVDHHLAHAASCYLVSPFKKAAILTVDGVGEWSTTTYGYGEDNEIVLLKELQFPHSLGLLYSAVTAYLGFKVNNDEYKVMGLASYGKPVYYDEFMKIIDLKEDGSFKLDMSYFVYHYKLTMFGKKFIKTFGQPRDPESEITERHNDIAASLQKVTEDVLFKILNHVYKETKSKNLCMAGGVALNSVANGKIVKNTPFRKMYIQPAASDAGTSLGVAMYIYNTILGKKRTYVMENVYLGPEFSDEHIENFLKKQKIKFKTFSNDDELIKKTSELILNNKIVGWFQGRMEWGPRALGNRSILANACSSDMKDILNEKVKHREDFRPFAPVIPREDVKNYFEIDKYSENSPFMLFVYPIKKNKHKAIPAVTHIDGSGRLQTIMEHENPRYYHLIREFEKLTGVPVLINTSFNIRGEPIVCTPENAYRCMMGTGIDYLVMGKYLIAREDNTKDMWDSWAEHLKKKKKKEHLE
jgi:carbamoyltransferase